jgi:hypothetical protein
MSGCTFATLVECVRTPSKHCLLRYIVPYLQDLGPALGMQDPAATIGSASYLPRIPLLCSIVDEMVTLHAQTGYPAPVAGCWDMLDPSKTPPAKVQLGDKCNSALGTPHVRVV